VKLIQNKILGKIDYKDKAQRMLSSYAKFWCIFIVIFFLVVILLQIIKTQVLDQSETMEHTDPLQIEMLNSDYGRRRRIYQSFCFCFAGWQRQRRIAGIQSAKNAPNARNFAEPLAKFTETYYNIIKSTMHLREEPIRILKNRDPAGWCKAGQAECFRFPTQPAMNRRGAPHTAHTSSRFPVKWQFGWQHGAFRPMVDGEALFLYHKCIAKLNLKEENPNAGHQPAANQP